MAKVLVIDDSLTVASMLKRLLEREGHEVAVEHDGPAGLARARQYCPALVVLDRVLPSMDGIDLCAELKSDASFGSTTVLMLTGSTDDSIARAAAEAGVNVLLTKDCGLGHVLAVAAGILEQKEAAA